MMGSWIGITLKEVGGASAFGGLEAEGQEFFASCLSEAILKRSAPEPKGTLSPLLIPTIPTFQHSMWFFRAQKPWAFLNEPFKNCPVYDVGMLSISSGDPCPTTCPPCSPPSGPRSMI